MTAWCWLSGANPAVLERCLMLWRFHRVRRARWQFLRIGLQRFQYFRDAAVELRIVTVDHRRGIIFHDDVWVHAMAFDHVPSVGRGGSEFRDEDLPSVEERPAARDTDNAAPGALANEWPHACLFEHIGKNVPVGSGRFVYQANLWSVENRAGIGIRLLVHPVKIRS